MNNNKYDYVIIGAGVVGSMIARWLSRYQADILLIDRDADIGMGASARIPQLSTPATTPNRAHLRH